MPRAEDFYHKLIQLGVVEVVRRRFKPPLIRWLPTKQRKAIVDIETMGPNGENAIAVKMPGEEVKFVPIPKEAEADVVRALAPEA